MENYQLLIGWATDESGWARSYATAQHPKFHGIMNVALSESEARFHLFCFDFVVVVFFTWRRIADVFSRA